MSPESRALMCARCRVGLKCCGDSDSDAVVTCPICGESDTLENAIRESTEHFVDEQVHQMLGNTLRVGGAIQYIPNQRADRIYRFIRDS
jgi:hypothetical protein